MKKTTCSKCSNPLEESRINQRYCKSCHADYMRKTRPKHSELKDEQKKKANTRAYTNEYVRRGYLKKTPCVFCNDPHVEAHHEDYDKPLEVMWLCRKCHLELHKNKKHLEQRIAI